MLYIFPVPEINKMKVINLANHKILASDAGLCNTAFSKAIGLMFSKNKKKSLVFKFDSERIIPLHMFFVFYPIDALFLNKKNIVVESKENFMPFRFYTPNKMAIYVIELPKGTIKKYKTKIGDKIKIF